MGKPKRAPWSRRHAIKLLDKAGITSPSAVYNSLRRRWIGSAKVPRELKVHIILCGAVCEWLEDLAQSQVIRCVERQRRHNEDSDGEKASSSILPHLATDMGAMLTLCRAGYDVQARSLLRGFIEKMDLLICIRHDPLIATAYIKAQGFEDSRDFFYRYISGGKLAKKARNIFKNKYPDATFIYEWVLDEWREGANLMLASAAHSNHAVAMISLFPNLGRGPSEAIGLGGYPTNGSNTTISMLFVASLPFFHMFENYPYGEVDGYIQEVGIDASRRAKYAAFFKLILTFPLVDTWLQDLDAARQDFPSGNDAPSMVDGPDAQCPT